MKLIDDLENTIDDTMLDIKYLLKNDDEFNDVLNTFVRNITCDVKKNVTRVYVKIPGGKKFHRMYQTDNETHALHKASAWEDYVPDATVVVCKKGSASEKLILKGIMP